MSIIQLIITIKSGRVHQSLTPYNTPSPAVRKITGAGAAAEEDVSRRRSEDATQMSDLTGRRVEPWEVAFFNGAAILDAIPVQSRDQGCNSIDI